MVLIDYNFQNTAIKKLYDRFISIRYGDSITKSTILQSPTGSGKTAMLIKLMDLIIKNDDSKQTAFVWLTPGAGELEKQSWNKASSNSNFVKPLFLLDSLSNGFKRNTVTFLNWELVNNKNNIAMRNGEKTNLPEAIKNAEENGIKFIIIVDEEHRNQTKKAQNIINMFNSEMIFKASATPIEDKMSKYVYVSEEDVIAEGLITQNVILNDQFNGVGSKSELNNSSDEDFLDVADEKRIQIKNGFNSLNKNINPLVLIQFPDEKKSSNEVGIKVKQVKEYLINELGQNENQIATWFSEDKTNVKYIERNDSIVNYLLMKQAVSTGWDAPRAKILVKLRLNTSNSFTIQTIGRIRRMPEKHYYDNNVLNNSYVYSNDSKYVYNVIKNGMGYGITQMGLKNGVDPNIFKIESRKIQDHPFKDVNAVTHSLHDEFKNEFHLNNDVDHNKKQLEKYHWKFTRSILTTIRTGEVSSLKDLTLKTMPVKTSLPITNTRDWGYRYDSVMDLIRPYLHVGDNLGNIRAIINDLFGIGDPGSNVLPLLQLRPKDRYAFVINNALLIRDVAKAMDSTYANEFNEQLSLLEEDSVKYIPFQLPIRDGYNDNGTKGKVLKKNVYLGYSTSNWDKQSHPEIELEKQLENIREVKWFYRSKDHGSKYFSISYDNGSREFFPDYLVMDNNNNTYIIEVKGAEGQNIDDYSEKKFYALKEYVKNHCDDNIKFAFVRPSLKHKGTLLFSNNIWDEKVDGSKNWKPIDELFYVK